jgi:outer membrane protein assembly factor BamD
MPAAVETMTARKGPAQRAVRSAAWALAVLVVTLGIAGCGSTPADESVNWTPEKLYAEAQEDMKSGNNERAARLLERLEGRAAGTLLGQQAQLDRAYILYRTNERAQALAVLERFIRLHPTSPAFDYALYLQGLANFNDNLGVLSGISRQDLSERDQQASREAYQSFRRLVEQFPASRYADDARQRINYIVNSLAAYELHVARYYFRRGAYIAAANRAQQAVQEFQQAPAAEEGLFLMAQSYDRLGLNQLRDDALRVLEQNFPNGSILRQGGRLIDKPWWQFW